MFELEIFLNKFLQKNKLFGHDRNLAMIHNHNFSFLVILTLNHKNGKTYERKECSIHDLFSRDSGIMESVKRINRFTDIRSPLCHYHSMSNLSSEEKVNYFIRNIDSKKV